ncbi:MAG: GNAT family N-acetyltransferase [Deltaproteobacteria bacterium]|nr:GNAT family N-acetyltransferase [Deltaproteobacteria bacterium]
MTSPRVSLRPLDVSDVDTVLRWINDPEVTQYLLLGRMPINRTRELEWLQKLYTSETDVVFAIVRTSDGTHVGSCGLHRIDSVDRSAEAGIMIGERTAWGHGFGTDAMELLLRYAFDVRGLNRVELEVFGDNARAIATYRKLGFREEGVHRQRRFKQGAFRDVLWMAMLRDEWKARPPPA